MLFDELEEELFDAHDDGADEEAEEAVSGELPPPRAQSELIGHADIEKKLLNLFESKRHPHAIIFAGPQGIGKSTMAFRLARYLLKTSEDANDPQGFDMFGGPPEPAKNLHVDVKDQVFSKVAAGGHPDLLTIERLYDEKKDRRKAEVSVEEIRRIAPFMRKTPAVDGGWRIVIVDDADTMNRNSQNSILKILEEPPEKSLIILITHRLGALLPTILSRASVENFYPLDNNLLKDTLSRVNPKLSADNRDLVISMAEGSLGRALEYADDKNLAVIAQSFELLAEWPRLDWTKIQYFSDTMGRGATDESQHSFQDGLMWLAGSLLKAKAANRAVPVGLERFSGIMADVSLAGWLQICDTLNQHFTRVQTGNLDKKFMVMGAFMVFENNV